MNMNKIKINDGGEGIKTYKGAHQYKDALGSPGRASALKCFQRSRVREPLKHRAGAAQNKDCSWPENTHCPAYKIMGRVLDLGQTTLETKSILK